MAMATEHKNGKLQTLTPSREQQVTYIEWIMEQITLLAEIFDQTLTPAKLRVYAEDLADILPERLVTAFDRARRELTFFPKIAELRDLAGMEGHDVDSAWEWIKRYIRRYGIERATLYHFADPDKTLRGEHKRSMEIRERQHAIRTAIRDRFFREHPDAEFSECPEPQVGEVPCRAEPPPPIPEAISYALRQMAFDLIGGLTRIKLTQEDPTMAGLVRRDFAEFYRRGRAVQQYWVSALASKDIAQSKSLSSGEKLVVGGELSGMIDSEKG